MGARHFRFAIVIGILAAFSFNAGSQSLAQNVPATDETERGISLQQQGKTPEAILLLRNVVKRNKRDVRAWHYLGLAFEQKGDPKEARKAHEKAARLGEDLLTKQLDMTTRPEFRTVLETISPSLSDAAASARRFIELNANLSKSTSSEWIERADYLADFAELSSTDGQKERFGKVYTAKEVTTKARILRKPEPQYSEEARQAQTTGTVLLRAILSADGRVRAIVPIVSLPHGLTGQSIRAARMIEFIPATFNGQPVSMIVQLEYYFNLY